MPAPMRKKDPTPAQIRKRRRRSGRAGTTRRMSGGRRSEATAGRVLSGGRELARKFAEVERIQENCQMNERKVSTSKIQLEVTETFG